MTGHLKKVGAFVNLDHIVHVGVTFDLFKMWKWFCSVEMY